MGGVEVDLRQASIAQPEAVLDVFAMWGGVEVRVPGDWEVVNRGWAFLGGFEDTTHHSAGTSKRLVVTGLAIMGGVEIKN
jgi:predicted membrane protein